MFDADAVIAEATKAQVATPAQAPEGATQTEPANEPAQEPAGSDPQDLASKPDSELTPEQLAKRQANRQSHENSKLAKLRRENRALRQAMQGQQPANTAQAPQNPANPAAAAPAELKAPTKPKEDDFKTWGEYQDAMDKYHEDMTDYKVEQKLAARDKQNQASKPVELPKEVVTRLQSIGQSEAKFAEQNPEYATLYEQNADFMQNMPVPVAHALMQVENASLALFTLMKEGKLDDLEDMSPAQVIVAVAQAEIRGQSLVTSQPQNRATNAPAPLTPAKGNATTGKAVHEKSVEELMEQFGQRR